jgi:hypothetical protein
MIEELKTLRHFMWSYVVPFEVRSVAPTKRSRVFDPEQFAAPLALIQNSDCVEIYLRIFDNNIDTRIFGVRGGTRSPQGVASTEAALPPVARASASRSSLVMALGPEWAAVSA